MRFALFAAACRLVVQQVLGGELVHASPGVDQQPGHQVQRITCRAWWDVRRGGSFVDPSQAFGVGGVAEFFSLSFEVGDTDS